MPAEVVNFWLIKECVGPYYTGQLLLCAEHAYLVRKRDASRTDILDRYLPILRLESDYDMICYLEAAFYVLATGDWDDSDTEWARSYRAQKRA